MIFASSEGRHKCIYADNGNCRKTWQIVNYLTSRKSKRTSVRELNLNGNSISNPSDLSNAFNVSGGARNFPTEGLCSPTGGLCEFFHG